MEYVEHFEAVCLASIKSDSGAGQGKPFFLVLWLSSDYWNPFSQLTWGRSPRSSDCARTAPDCFNFIDLAELPHGLSSQYLMSPYADYFKPNSYYQFHSELKKRNLCEDSNSYILLCPLDDLLGECDEQMLMAYSVLEIRVYSHEDCSLTRCLGETFRNLACNCSVTKESLCLWLVLLFAQYLASTNSLSNGRKILVPLENDTYNSLKLSYIKKCQPLRFM